MTPIFKSCYSIGKSILTLDDGSSDGGPDSIIEICKENGLKTLVLVEDSMTGFMKAVNLCKKAKINLVFGLRLNCCNEINNETAKSDHKIIIFAKNDSGCKLLNEIVSYSQIEGNDKVDFKYLNSVWDDNCLQMAIPFYDSFIFNNNMHLSNCLPDLSVIKPIFFLEDNGLPFDGLMRDIVKAFCGDKYETMETKSIYYKNKEDFEALQTYKILCTRSFGKQACLSRPNLDHFGSNEFCFESFLEKTAQ